MCAFHIGPCMELFSTQMWGRRPEIGRGQSLQTLILYPLLKLVSLKWAVGPSGR